MEQAKMGKTLRIEWPTLSLILACYGAWFALALRGQDWNPLLWIAATSAVTALYWSLVHEAIHGHPTASNWVNLALVYVPIGWIYSVGRFQDGHLEHHETGALTDPFDDTESWYLAKRDWNRLPAPSRALLSFNNTVLGRLTVGPVITLWRMVATDLGLAIRPGPKRLRVRIAWLAHVPGVVLLAWFLSHHSAVPAWQFAAAAHGGAAIILIRTFLEHQASPNEGERTVIVEDKGPLAFLFLFNNLHFVHHARPSLAWYRLPGFYAANRDKFLARNNGYAYRSYLDVFRRHFLKAKEPVPHPYVD
jgi:fatty acid desaturase